MKLTKKAKIILLCLAFSAAAVTAYAATQSKSIKKVDNIFTPANIGIAVQENDDENKNPAPNNNELTWTESGDTLTAEKKVQIYNRTSSGESGYEVTNPTAAFIRVCLIPRWTTTHNQTEVDVLTDTNFPDSINDNTYTQGGVTFTLAENWAENWIYGKDGYFYCITPVQPGEATPLLLTSVSIAKSDVNNGLTLHVDVLADSIQTEGQDEGETTALTERWGDSATLGIEIKDGVLCEYSPQEGSE